MAFFKKEEKTEITPQEIVKRVEELEAALKDTKKELADVKKYILKTLTKVGVVRFNAFHEMGGDQSFSVALLDEKKNGVVITSYYGRDLNRVYAKAVKDGESKHELAEEEKKAIAKATNSK